MLSWTSFNIKSVHENAFRGFRGHYLWKIEVGRVSGEMDQLQSIPRKNPISFHPNYP